MKPAGKSAIDLVEEGTHLLRTAPVGTLATYYVGTAPFVLGLLYFWVDMSHNPFADQHLADAALGMAVLFIWMKFCQALFARRVRAHLAADTPPRLQFREAVRILTIQMILQPLGLLPIALCLLGLFYILPLGLLMAVVVALLLPFFHNVTAVGHGNAGGALAVFKKAWRLWWIWRRQNFIMLLIVYFFGVYVFLNWSVFCASLPRLLNTLFGIETVFSRSPSAMLNSTFFAGMFALSYLCVDPILKTLYALRCFYGESLKSGEDLKAELKRFSALAQGAVVALVLAVTLCGLTASGADNPTPTSGSPQTLTIEQPNAGTANKTFRPISTPDLDQAINQTIHERKYTWRMPHERKPDANGDEGLIARFFDKIADLIRKGGKAVANWMRDIMDWISDWIRGLFPNRTGSYTQSSGTDWMMLMQFLLFVLIAAVLSALVIFIYRVLQNRQPRDVVVTEAIAPLPDVADENVGADQLPEDGWTKLARELLERGEFRLAMRAFYLANLAHLAQRNLISIARFKSNREYERELQRRGHSFPDLLSTFGDNLSVFERIWYGLHEVNRDIVGQFATNVERMKGAG